MQLCREEQVRSHANTNEANSNVMTSHYKCWQHLLEVCLHRRNNQILVLILPNIASIVANIVSKYQPTNQTNQPTNQPTHTHTPGGGISGQNLVYMLPGGWGGTWLGNGRVCAARCSKILPQQGQGLAISDPRKDRFSPKQVTEKLPWGHWKLFTCLEIQPIYEF